MKLEMLCYFVLLTASTSSTLMRTGLGTELTIFSHKVISNNILSITRNVGSAVQCVILCLEMQACVSVFYRQASKKCQIHDVLFPSAQDGEEENGTKYYSLTAGSCPQGYIHARMLGLCYQPHLSKKMADEAAEDCATRGEHLIVINSQEKQDHLRKQLTSSSGVLAYNYFIDGSDAETEGQWLYHDGRAITFFAWAEGYPKNTTSYKDSLVASKKNGYLWQDRDGTFERFYICEKDM